MHDDGENNRKRFTCIFKSAKHVLAMKYFFSTSSILLFLANFRRVSLNEFNVENQT